MKPSDMLPTPLDGRPKVKLTEIGRRDAGEGWQTVTYQGDDGRIYQASVKDWTEKNWVLMPSLED